ncbi:ABC transporter substrate-binding protein [Herbiconiux moechotypicola]|uniref:ABC transporter substrate-binding protein n=1 Tax=Herbiconiux moechotypicola TaxID=637393 RepID=A0ABN3DFA9_9MICO|nr:ABC transporter substrate-binding protein [Herbiconiux moechotypicola]MCS5729235.1 ABC transporter substrate-binding protein [Herbiconiux moechotypicola]
MKNLATQNSRTALKRSALLVVPALTLAALAGCSSSDTGAASTAAGEWSYTDATGTTVTLDHTPERIASYTDYAVGLMSYGIDPVAIFGRFDVASDTRFDEFDITDTAVVGNSYGEIDLEALAEAAPDLIVTGIYPTDREGTLDTEGAYYGVADVEQQEQLEKIAPVVAIEVGGRGLDVIESLTALAEDLGADASTVAAAKAEFDAAAADLTAAGEESDVEVTQMYADADGIYVVKPQDEPETQLYSELGVTFTDLNPDTDYYWDIYSWENAAQMMTGDVLLVNNEGFQEADLLAQPTFASHPALAAGQVHDGWVGAALDYHSQAAHMEELATILRDSKKLG